MEQINPLPNPSVNPPSSNKSVLIVLLIVFVVILVSLNAYLFMKLQNPAPAPVASPAPVVQTSPTPTLLPAEASAKEGDPTTNWKTYESTRFKFSFKYPSILVLDNQYENTYIDYGGINLYSQEEYRAVVSKEGKGGGSFIEIWIYTNPQNLTTMEWMKKGAVNSNFSGQEYSIIDIGGEKGYIYQWSGAGTGLQAVISKNDYTYTISDSGYDDYLNQILSTFKFLD